MKNRKRKALIWTDWEQRWATRAEGRSSANFVTNYLRTSTKNDLRSILSEYKQGDDEEGTTLLTRYLLEETSIGLPPVTPPTRSPTHIPTSLPTTSKQTVLPTSEPTSVSTSSLVSPSSNPTTASHASTDVPTLQPTFGTTSLLPPTSGPTFQPTAERIVLYSNDFEEPNENVNPGGCPPINQRGINRFYGTNENVFNQRFTVEVFIVDSMWNSTVPYADPEGRAGSYAISMLSQFQHDLLGLGFSTFGKAFINVAMDISSIDIPCAFGPFGIAAPIFRVSLLDDPSGTVPLTGVALDFADMTGPAGPNPWTFHWTRGSVSLNATGSTTGRVSIVFDLLQSGYGAFDNLIVQASDEPGTAK